MASDAEIDEKTARNIVKNHRFDIGGNVATYWMKRCDEAELEIARLKSRLDSLHRSKYEYAKAENDRLREALEEIASGEHGEYCGNRNAMLTQGGKSKCFADCPVRVAKDALALAPPADGKGGEP